MVVEFQNLCPKTESIEGPMFMSSYVWLYGFFLFFSLEITVQREFRIRDIVFESSKSSNVGQNLLMTFRDVSYIKQAQTV